MNSSEEYPGLGRRQFLKIVGFGAASLSSAAGLPVMAGPFTSPGPQVKHFVPADKKLSLEWVRGLFRKGAPRVCRGKELDTIGMPVGGIGAGQLYLRGDGTLAVWQIFNKHHFSGYGERNYAQKIPESPVDQGFVVIVEDPDSDKPAGAALNREDFPGVEFVGEYPMAKVRFVKEGFPLKVELEAFSPFIPLNPKDSALPATVFQITVENVTEKSLWAGVLGWLENPVCTHSASEVTGLRKTRFTSEKGRGLLVHGAEEAPRAEKPALRPKILLADFEGTDYGQWKATGEAFGTKPVAGTLPNQQSVSGFAGKGLVNTFLGGDPPHGKLTSPSFPISRKHINFLIGGGSHAGKTCMNLLVNGKVARTAAGKDNEKLEWHSWNVADLEGEQAVIEIVDEESGGWGHINVDQIELADERAGGPSGPIDKLEDYGSMVLAVEGATEPPSDAHVGRADVAWANISKTPGKFVRYPISERRKDGLVAGSEEIKIAPGSKRTFTFVLAWHFPNHPQGHNYANYFKDATEVAHYVLDNLPRLAGDTRKWHDTFYDSTLPHWLLDRLHSTVSNLATGTCQWWKSGRFWAWEGVGCCEGTCTHVWNYAQAMARLFPELERSAREMQDLGEALQPDGLVGFRGERNGHYAADGQAGTVLKCYREHLMSADDGFLKRSWPKIKTVLEFSMRHDGNDDGLIEDSQHNTYDINFEGPNTFVGSLYLAALRAGEEMAKEMGDQDFAARLRKIFESGSRLSAEKLWNGEYFIQLVDLKKHPKHQYGDGCLSDQLFGQGWAHQLGLGYIYPREKVQDGLRSVWKYNWAPDIGPQNAAYKPDRWFVSPGEAGLFTCTWPKSEHLNEGVLYRDEVWTGIEYQVAGHMAWEGMLTEAMILCRAVHDRYDPSKHNPFNEIECGDHYARALASWGVFTALSGYEHHGPKGYLAFAPRITPESFRAAFTAAEGWGTFSQSRSGDAQTEKIEVRWGKLRLRSLAFQPPPGKNVAKVAVTAGGKPVESTHSIEKGRIVVELRGEVALKEGEILEATLSAV
jgi:uncharacterized protein (DUF608 family)